MRGRAAAGSPQAASTKVANVRNPLTPRDASAETPARLAALEVPMSKISGRDLAGAWLQDTAGGDR